MNIICIVCVCVFYLTVIICPLSRLMPFIWAIKMAATASYRAVPSILMVAPMGSTKRVTRLSSFRFSSKQRKVTGNVPALRKDKKKMFLKRCTKNRRNRFVVGHKIGRQVVQRWGGRWEGVKLGLKKKEKKEIWVDWQPPPNSWCRPLLQSSNMWIKGIWFPALLSLGHNIIRENVDRIIHIH